MLAAPPWGYKSTVEHSQVMVRVSGTHGVADLFLFVTCSKNLYFGTDGSSEVSGANFHTPE